MSESLELHINLEKTKIQEFQLQVGESDDKTHPAKMNISEIPTSSQKVWRSTSICKIEQF